MVEFSHRVFFKLGEGQVAPPEVVLLLAEQVLLMVRWFFRALHHKPVCASVHLRVERGDLHGDLVHRSSSP